MPAAERVIKDPGLPAPQHAGHATPPSRGGTANRGPTLEIGRRLIAVIAPFTLALGIGGPVVVGITLFLSYSLSSPAVALVGLLLAVGFFTSITASSAAGRAGGLATHEMRSIERRFAVGSCLVAAGIGALTLAVCAETADVEPRLVAMLMALAVLGLASGTSTGRPWVVRVQALLIAPQAIIAILLFWPRPIMLIAAGGIAAYALVIAHLAKAAHDRDLKALTIEFERDLGRRRLELALSHMPHALALATSDGVVIAMNHRFRELLGIGAEEHPVGQPLAAVIARAPRLIIKRPDERQAALGRMAALAKPRAAFASVLTLDDGNILDVQVNFAPDGGWVVVLRDTMTDRAAFAEVSREARRCPLTGLANRRAFNEELDRRLAALRQDGSDGFALFILDLDSFKSVNDLYGHPVGDRLLTFVSVALQMAVPDGFVARLGGDEFACILSGQALASPHAAARRIVEAFRQPFVIDGLSLQAGCAIGYALAPADGADATLLMRRADLALITAKKAADPVLRFEPALELANELRHRTEARVANAVASKRLSVAFQPILSLATGRVACIEALVRWPQDQLPALSATELVEVAERKRLISDVRRIVLDQGIRCVASLRSDLCLAVNVASSDITSADFAAQILRALKAYGLAPSRLTLELTESGFPEDPAACTQVLADLRGQGVKVSVDDFGAGYSSLARLHCLPLDEMKLDRLLLRNGRADDGARTVFRSAVRLGRELNLCVVAEGLESVSDLALCRATGVGRIQGHMFGRAVPAGDLADALVAAEAALERALPAAAVMTSG